MTDSTDIPALNEMLEQIGAVALGLGVTPTESESIDAFLGRLLAQAEKYRRIHGFSPFKLPDWFSAHNYEAVEHYARE